MHFSLRQLEALVAVADTGSFTRAADHLHLSPSAVSQLIIELEAGVGYKLFDRHTRKVILSPAGRSFIPSAHAVLRQVEQARTAAADIRDQAAGVVRIAAPLVVAGFILPDVIARYRAKHPRVVVRVIDASVEHLVELVASREVDIAVGPDRPVVPEVERVNLYSSPWAVWCASGHPFSRMRAVSWKDLFKADMVAAGRDHEIHLAAMMRQLPDNQRAVPEYVVDNVSTALGLASKGMCYTIAPEYVQPLAEPLGLVSKRIVDPDVSREMSMFRPSDRELSPAASGFSEQVVTLLRDTQT